MRGRTLNDSFIILDEAQNTSPEQMKMFLTRLGFGSKMVVTGDVTQIDLPHSRTSGLVTVPEVLDAVDDITIVEFDGHDVVRHKLVQRIVNAYKAHDDQVGSARARHAAPAHHHDRGGP
jgi:phosphate starvation-inducible PhoH-like protein